jgi:glucose/arabinose dehydrogenase
MPPIEALPFLRRAAVLLALALLPAAVARAGDPLPYEAVPAFPALRFESPLFLTFPPDGTDRLFVAEQDGRVRWFENRADAKDAVLAVDLSAKVRRVHNEEGLLGLAFHPEFRENRRVYLHYSASDPRRNVLSEFRMDASGARILPATERVVLEVEQPYGNHNGGMIAFGPDGFLYIALGDGGAGGDPHDNAQRLDTLLGKILRIDVDKAEAGRAYALPPDNPFAGRKDARGEIWAYGLRNAWRFSFDRKTGALWAGDVGQNEWEEVDVVVKGGNYGWNAREGKHPYRPRGRTGPFVDPVAEHGRNDAQSVTGGYVYRGKRLPPLEGAYVYGDFMSGNVWALRLDGGRTVSHELVAKGGLVSSFGEDRDGELYFTSFDGRIYSLRRRSP